MRRVARVEETQVVESLVRDVESDDVDTLVRFVGEHDRVLVRVAAALASTEDMLVAVADGAVRGAVSIRWAGGCADGLPWLYGAEVEEGYRRRGIGTALWHVAEGRCRDRGAPMASLDVEATNADARRLYERLGYAVVGPHRHHWRALDPTTGEVVAEGDSDPWRMRKPLRKV
jgi:ribosomal protein S18 acetylase RimI-like enzyme